MFEGKIRDANPWWNDPTAIGRDPAILNMERSHVKRILGEQHRFAAGDRIYTLRGPRRVGKTTLLKMEIMRLLGEGIPPLDVLYYSFEAGDRPADVRILLAEYLAMNGGRGRRFVFLDEVAGIRNWGSEVEKMLECGRLRNCTLVATGSDAAVAGASALRCGPRNGRGSGSSDRILQPMGFGEYAASRDEEVRSALRGLSLGDGQGRIETVRSVLGGEVPERVKDLLPLVDVLNAHFHEYMLSGGMPGTAGRLASGGLIPDEEYQDCLGMAYADLAGAGLRHERAAAILKSAARSVGTAASWQALAAGTDIENPRVAEKYARKMAGLRMLHVLYRYDFSQDASRHNALKKLYFCDPFLLNAWESAGRPDPFARSVAALGDELHAGPLVEQAAACHVFRLASGLNTGGDQNGPFDTVFYWKGSRGREVDFVVRAGRGRVVPIDVKWQGRVRRGDLHGMFDFRKAAGMGGSGGAVLSRDSAEERSGMAIVPASVFALLV